MLSDQINLDELVSSISSEQDPNTITELLEDIVKDANRYRFLRDEDDWGDDGLEPTYETLIESTMCAFDEIVDQRMQMSCDECQEIEPRKCSTITEEEKLSERDE